MEKIGQIIQANRKQTSTLSDCCNSISESSKKAWLARWKGRSDIERVFAPVQWGYTLQNPEKAYMSDCPTMMQYDAVYGQGSSEFWVEVQMSGVFGASSSKEKGVADGIRIFCQSFAAEAKGFKLSELMLFFARYKAGRYDNSYASFDARRIGNAFFKEFVPERNKELDTINRRMIQEEIERRRFVPPQGHSSLSWYRELKQRAESGDEEARKMLSPP